jgi:hypothetical protein
MTIFVKSCKWATPLARKVEAIQNYALNSPYHSAFVNDCNWATDLAKEVEWKIFLGCVCWNAVSFAQLSKNTVLDWNDILINGRVHYRKTRKEDESFALPKDVIWLCTQSQSDNLESSSSSMYCGGRFLIAPSNTLSPSWYGTFGILWEDYPEAITKNLTATARPRPWGEAIACL